MRKCEDCLHYLPPLKEMPTPRPGEMVMWSNEYDNLCLVHRASCYTGCDDFWPKSGATCEECRFGEVDEEFEDAVICHLSKRYDTRVKDWYCEMWRAKE